jgi:hypothetical protein
MNEINAIKIGKADYSSSMSDLPVSSKNETGKYSRIFHIFM